MLADVTSDDRMDKVSSAGYAWGYIGSCIPFVISLALVLLYDQIGLTFNTAMVAAFAVTGIWWLCMSIPLLKAYEQKNFVESKRHPLRDSISRIVETLKDMRNEPQVLLFVVSFFLYIDGVYTIIDMATAYGEALGLDSTGLLLALLVTQIVAFPFALLFGRLAQKYSTEKLITVCIAAYVLIAIYAIFLRTQAQPFADPWYAVPARSPATPVPSRRPMGNGSSSVPLFPAQVQTLSAAAEAPVPY